MRLISGSHENGAGSMQLCGKNSELGNEIETHRHVEDSDCRKGKASCQVSENASWSLFSGGMLPVEWFPRYLVAWSWSNKRPLVDLRGDRASEADDDTCENKRGPGQHQRSCHRASRVAGMRKIAQFLIVELISTNEYILRMRRCRL